MLHLLNHFQNRAPVLQGARPHRAGSERNAVMFPDASRRACKGLFRAEVRERALQGERKGTWPELRGLTKGAKASAAPSQPQHLFNNGDEAIGGLPRYFFLNRVARS